MRSWKRKRRTKGQLVVGLISPSLLSRCSLPLPRLQTHSVQLPSQEWSSTVLSLVLVTLVSLEENSLVLQRSRDGLLLLDISLTSVHDGDVSETKRDDSTGENVDDVGSLVPIHKRTKEQGGRKRSVSAKLDARRRKEARGEL